MRISGSYICCRTGLYKKKNDSMTENVFHSCGVEGPNRGKRSKYGMSLARRRPMHKPFNVCKMSLPTRSPFCPCTAPFTHAQPLPPMHGTFHPHKSLELNDGRVERR